MNSFETQYQLNKPSRNEGLLSVDNLIKTDTKDIILNTIDKKNSLIILESDIEQNISEEDFEFKLLNLIKNNNGHRSIDLSQFKGNKKIHTYINNIIGNNYPLIEISRLIEGEKLVNLTFLGIKKLNDKVGKELVDLVINKLKQLVTKNFEKKIKGEKHGRIIRSNYKHITFSMDKKINTLSKIFNNITNIDKLLEVIFENITSNELLKVTGKNISNRQKEEILLEFKEIFEIGIGLAHIEKNNDIYKKLLSFYKGEISSRHKKEINDTGDDEYFDFLEIKQYAKSAIEIEKEIIEKYSGKKFIHDKVEFDIVVMGKINPLLIKYIRKSEEVIYKNETENLKNKIEKYIEYLNNGFDFIAPIVDEEEVKKVKNINSQISSLEIDIDLIKKNYKNTLSTNAIKEITKGKKGIRMFIDIVDMGITNLRDFRDLAIKVNSGEINEENMNELLEAGKTATNSFQNLVREIKNKYPDSEISLGGDEIFIFFPNTERKLPEDIIKDISKSISNFSMKGRISTGADYKNEKIFDNLDTSTSINKIFEKFIEKIINSYKLNESGPGITSIDISTEIFKIFNENIDYFLELIKKETFESSIEAIFKNNKNSKSISYNLVKENGEKIKGIFNIFLEREGDLVKIKIN